MRVACLYCAHIGSVDPAQFAFCAAHPYRAWNGVKQRADGIKLRQHFAVALAQPRKFEPVAGDFADAQNRAPAHRASLGFEVAPARAGERHAKSFAAGAQPVHIRFKLMRRFGRQPGAKAEYAAGRLGIRDKRQIALDVRLAAGGAPSDDDLLFGGEKNIGAVEPGAQLGQLADEGSFALRPLLAPGEMQKRRNGGNQHQRDDE